MWYAKEYAAIMGTRPLAKPSGNSDFLTNFEFKKCLYQMLVSDLKRPIM